MSPLACGGDFFESVENELDPGNAMLSIQKTHKLVQVLFFEDDFAFLATQVFTTLVV